MHMIKLKFKFNANASITIKLELGPESCCIVKRSAMIMTATCMHYGGRELSLEVY